MDRGNAATYLMTMRQKHAPREDRWCLVPGTMTTMMLHMRRYCVDGATSLFAVVVTVGLICVAGCSAASTSAPSTPTSSAPSAAPSAPAPALSATVYQSPDGYSIRPPAGWIMHPTGGQDGLSVLFTAPTVDKAVQKPFADNLSVAIQSTTESLDSLISETKQKYPSFLANYKVVTDQPIAVAGGQPAHLLGGTYDVEGTGTLENIQLTVTNPGKAYTVTFTSPAGSFDNYHDQIQAALASFALS